MTFSMKPPQNRSSHIRSIGYDEDTNTMAVEFNSGGTYHYPGVGKHIYDALHGAESVGSYFHKSIRGKFTPRKV